MAKYSNTNAANFYKQNSINTASPARLTIMLYDGAVKFCNIALEGMDENDITKIINMKLKDLKDKYKDKIDIKIASKVIDDIIKETNFEEYGARKVNKVIKDEIETIIIEALIDNKTEIQIKEMGQTV